MYFLFGIHNHQPGGNFDNIKEKAFKKAYFPFLKIIKTHPKIKFSLHISGPLYDWIKKRHPQYLFELKKMVKSGQVEIWGGPYGEAILPMIPQKDAKEQICFFSKILEKDFNCKINGFWIPERVWEPSLFKIFSGDHIQITALDEIHFELAGILPKKIDGYFLEDPFLINDKSNKSKIKSCFLKIFPISKKLRYTIPFSYPQEVVNWILRQKNYGKISVTYFDDGEKFGLWPTTYNWVYQRKWLDKFLSLIEKNSKIQTIHFKDFVQCFPQNGNVNIPSASYPEMMEWTLPLEIRKKIERNQIKKEKRKKYFLTQARFENFFQKYPESNHLRSKMYYVSQKISTASVFLNNNFNKIKKHLFEAQTNDSYWHGGFGGLYHPHLRFYAYRNLILAEKQLDQSEKIKIFDFNKDDKKEIIVETKNINLYINPENGGSISEIDLKNQGYNILNVLTRREESYHQLKKQKQKEAVLKKEPKTIHKIEKSLKGFEDLIIYDKYQKLSFIDHFLVSEQNILDNFYNSDLKEKFNCIGKNYQYKVKKLEDQFDILMQRKIKNVLDFKKKISISKNKRKLDFSFKFENKSKKNLKFLFGTEWNLFLPNGQNIKIFINRARRSPLTIFQKNTSYIALFDKFFKIKISFNFEEDISLCHFPIFTVSQRENKFEKIYQGSSFLFLFPIEIQPKEILDKHFSLKF